MTDQADPPAPDPAASRSGLRRLAPFAVAALAVVAAGLFVFLRGGADEQGGKLGMIDSGRPELGQRAPNFALIDARDGTAVRRLADYRGKTVVLNWYATWCGPCKAEIPDFQRVADSFPDQVVVVGVNLRESRGDAVAMLNDLGARFPALLDSNGAVASHYRLLGMPSTLIIDRDGILRAAGSGRIEEDALRVELAKIGVK